MKIFAPLGFGLLAIASCASSTSNTANTTTVDTTVTQEVTVKSDTLNDVLDHYFSLKEALVASDAEKAAQAAEQLSTALFKIEGCETTAELAGNIQDSDDLEKQRADFSIISKDLIAMYQHAEVTSGALYVAHCPMYNDDQGGDWLSSYEEITNPYFGDKMMKCGRVKQTLK